MTGGPRVLSIQEFLHAYILGGGLRHIDAEPDPDELDLPLAHLRAEMARHELRTMKVVSRGSVETITRCRSCPREQGWPCTALRVLAMPYARHPAYRSEWRLLSVDKQLVGADDAPDTSGA